MFDQRLLTLLTVIEEKNYSKAAEKLNMTQPSVSNHIKKLELDYGITIFKDLKKFELSEEGALMRDYAIFEITSHEQFVTKLKESNHKAGINIGLTSIISSGMNDTQRNILNKLDECNPSFYVYPYSIIAEKLTNGDLDFAIIDNSFDSSIFDSAVLNTCNLCLVCSANGVYKTKERITREQLLNTLVVVGDEQSGLTKCIKHALNLKNIKLRKNNIIHTSDITWMIGQVVANDAIGFVYEEAVKSYIDTGIIRKIELLNFKAKQNIYLIYPRGEFKGRKTVEVIDELKRYEGIYGRED